MHSVFGMRSKRIKQGYTGTHSMACHRKSPRSRRNLIVIDPLTLSQGHQFDRRLNFSVYPGPTAHPL